MDEIDAVRTLFAEGLKFLDSGDFRRAEQRFRRTLELRPQSVPTLSNLAFALSRQGRVTEARQCAEHAAAIAGRDASVLMMLADCLAQEKKFAEVLAVCDRALAIEPNMAALHCNRGFALKELQRHVEALASYDKAIALEPGFIDAHLNRGAVLSRVFRHEEALASYDQALSLAPARTEPAIGRGNALFGLRRYDAALAEYDRALELNPAQADAWVGRGNALARLKRREQALAAFDRALQLRPDLADGWIGRSSVCFELKRLDDAAASCERALTLRPDAAEAWLARGHVLAERKRYDEALAACGQALRLSPNLADAWVAQGIAFAELRRLDEALSSYEQALARRQDVPGAALGQANIFTELNRTGDALAAYDRALKVPEDHARALVGRGNLFIAQHRYEDAFAAIDQAFAIEPGLADLAGMRLYVKMQLCDWSNFAAERADLLAQVRAGAQATPPLALLALSPSAADQLLCARLTAEAGPPAATPAPRHCAPAPERRIRVAYLSVDMHEHAVAFLAAGMFEHHDRSQFEIFIVSYGPDRAGQMRTRLKGAVEHFLDLRSESDAAVVTRLRKLGIDIAVDLSGHTSGARPGIVAARPAAVQVNYLGYPGTAGSSYHDYIIADRFTVPQEAQRHYSEKVVYMPDSFQVNDDSRPAPRPALSRAAAGLPQQGLVFCSFNNSVKLTPEVFDIWMRLLRKVEGSVLWILAGSATSERNLRREASARGVAPERIAVAPRVGYLEYLARYQLADLFLDSWPYNGGTTASDALWMGLPVVTCTGEAFASRMAGSLLHGLGLPELVAQSLPEYEALALALAADRQRLGAIKARLQRTHHASAVFNTGRFTRHLESAYRTMCERHWRGEPCAGFVVSPVEDRN